MVPNKKKPAKKKRPRARASRSTWTEGERRIDRMAREAGIKPIGDLEDLVHLTQEEGEELLSAIREMRELERRAEQEKEKRKRTTKRA